MADKCEECGSPDEAHHRVECSKATPERRAELYKCYYEMMQRTCQRNARAFDLMRDKVTFWQGKCAILKHENNTLRRKLGEKKNVEAEVRAKLAAGGKLQAIRLYRDRTGAPLKDAKMYVEGLNA